jgi:hypothetical protein
MEVAGKGQTFAIVTKLLQKQALTFNFGQVLELLRHCCRRLVTFEICIQLSRHFLPQLYLRGVLFARTNIVGIGVVGGHQKGHLLVVPVTQVCK